jgi:hypothetical protein
MGVRLKEKGAPRRETKKTREMEGKAGIPVFDGERAQVRRKQTLFMEP